MTDLGTGSATFSPNPLTSGGGGQLDNRLVDVGTFQITMTVRQAGDLNPHRFIDLGTTSGVVMTVMQGSVLGAKSIGIGYLSPKMSRVAPVPKRWNPDTSEWEPIPMAGG